MRTSMLGLYGPRCTEYERRKYFSRFDFEWCFQFPLHDLRPNPDTNGGSVCSKAATLEPPRTFSVHQIHSVRNWPARIVANKPKYSHIYGNICERFCADFLLPKEFLSRSSYERTTLSIRCAELYPSHLEQRLGLWLRHYTRIGQCSEFAKRSLWRNPRFVLGRDTRSVRIGLHHIKSCHIKSCYIISYRIVLQSYLISYHFI